MARRALSRFTNLNRVFVILLLYLPGWLFSWPGYECFTLDYKIPEVDSWCTIDEMRDSLEGSDFGSSLYDYFAYYYPYLKVNNTKAGHELELFLHRKFKGGIGLRRNFLKVQYFAENAAKSVDEISIDVHNPPAGIEITGTEKLKKNDKREYELFLEKIYSIAPEMKSFRDPFTLSCSVRTRFMQYLKDNETDSMDLLTKVYLVRQFMEEVMHYGGRYDIDEGSDFGQGAMYLCEEYESGGSCTGDCTSGLLLYMTLAEEAGLKITGGLVTKSVINRNSTYHSCGLVELENGQYITVDIGLSAIGIEHKRIELLTKEEFVLLQIGTQFPETVLNKLFYFFMNYKKDIPLYAWDSLLGANKFNVGKNNRRKEELFRRMEKLFDTSTFDSFQKDYLHASTAVLCNELAMYDKALEHYKLIRDRSVDPEYFLLGAKIYDGLNEHEGIELLFDSYISKNKPYDSERWKLYTKELFFIANYFAGTDNFDKVEYIIGGIKRVDMLSRNDLNKGMFLSFNNILRLNYDNTKYIFYLTEHTEEIIPGVSVEMPPFTVTSTDEDDVRKIYIPGVYNAEINGMVLAGRKRKYYTADIYIDEKEKVVFSGLKEDTPVEINGKEYTFLSGARDGKYDLKFGYTDRGDAYISFGHVDQEIEVSIGGRDVAVKADTVFFREDGSVSEIVIPSGVELDFPTLWGNVTIAENGLSITDIRLDKKGRVINAGLKADTKVEKISKAYTFLSGARDDKYDLGFSYTDRGDAYISYGFVDQDIAVSIGGRDVAVKAEAVSFRGEGSVSDISIPSGEELDFPTLWGNVTIADINGSSLSDIMLDKTGRGVAAYLKEDTEVEIGGKEYTFLSGARDGNYDLKFGYTDRGDAYIRYGFVDQEIAVTIGGRDVAVKAEILFFREDGSVSKIVIPSGEELDFSTLWGNVTIADINGSSVEDIKFDENGRVINAFLKEDTKVEIGGKAYTFLSGARDGNYDLGFSYTDRGDAYISYGYLGAGALISLKNADITMNDGGGVYFDKDGTVTSFSPSGVSQYRGIKSGEEFLFNEHYGSSYQLVNNTLFKTLYGDLEFKENSYVKLDDNGQLVSGPLKNSLVINTHYGPITVEEDSYIEFYENYRIKSANHVTGTISINKSEHKISSIGFYKNGEIEKARFVDGEEYGLRNGKDLYLLTMVCFDIKGNIIKGEGAEGTRITINNGLYILDDSLYNMEFSRDINNKIFISKLNALHPFYTFLNSNRITLRPDHFTFSSKGEIVSLSGIGNDLTFTNKYGSFVLSDSYYIDLYDNHVAGGTLVEDCELSYNDQIIVLAPWHKVLFDPASGVPLLFTPKKGEAFLLLDGTTWEQDQLVSVCLNTKGELFIDNREDGDNIEWLDFYVIKKIDNNGISLTSLLETDYSYNGVYYHLKPYEWVVVE